MEGQKKSVAAGERETQGDQQTEQRMPAESGQRISEESEQKGDGADEKGQ